MMFPFSHGGFRHRWHSCVAARERHILWLYDIMQISDTQICNPNSDQISQVYIYSMTHFVSVRLCITIHIMCAQKLECIPILGDVINPRPVVPHKAVAEVSKIGRYRRGELLWCMDGRANPLMDGKVVGVVLFGVLAMVAVVTSPTTAGCSVL